MKKLRVLSLLLTLCLTFCACGGQAPQSEVVSAPAESFASAPAAEANVPEVSEEVSVPEEEPYDEVFAIVHTNDVHGFISIEPYVKAVADDLKAQYGEENVLTVSAGDVFAGGNAVAHLYKGELIPPVMDMAGYDLLVPGNNDFNLGADALVSLGHAAENMQTICANLYEMKEDGSQGESIFSATAEFTTAGGTKVGVFGVTVSGGSIADLFVNPGSIESSQASVTALQESGCGVIIGVGHTGWNDDLVTPSSNDTTSAELVKQVSGIDGFIDSHTHSIIGSGNGWVCPETGTLVNQASCKGECLGIMTFYLKDGKVVDKTAELLMAEDLQAYTPDADTQKLVDEAFARLEADTGDAYTTTEYFLNGLRTSDSSDGRSIRTDETNLGDLITDFLCHTTGADVALMPGYRIRSSVEAGPITAVSLYDVFANGADIYVMELTGEELLNKMASNMIDLPNESTQFNQWGGASFGYVMGENKTFTIVNPMVGGEPLDLEKTYTVAMDLGGPDAPADQTPLISGMEMIAEQMGEYMASPECTIYPDEPTPNDRIVPMEAGDIPADAVTYEVTATMAPPPDGGSGTVPPDVPTGGMGEEPPGGFGGGGEISVAPPA